MIIEVVFSHVSKSSGHQSFKKELLGWQSHYKAMGQTGFHGVKQDDVKWPMLVKGRSQIKQ